MKHWRRWVAIGIPAVLVVGAAAVLLPIELSKVTVPDLTGESLPAARAQLAALGLELGGSGMTDPAAEPFTAIDQQGPEAGRRIARGGMVTVHANALEVTVPDLAGLTMDQAVTALQEAGLTARSEATTWPAVVPEDFPGTMRQVLDPLGAAGVTAADYGDPGAAAAGRTMQVGREAAGSWPVAGMALASDGTAVEAGRTLTAGTPIALTARVPVMAMPDLSGKRQDDAVAALAGIGVEPAISGGGVVTRQSPAAGTTILGGEGGTSVSLGLQHYVRYEASATFGRGWMQWVPPGSTAITVDDNAKLPWSQTWWDTTSYGHLTVGPKGVSWKPETASCRIVVDGVVVADESDTLVTPNVTCG